MISKTSAQRAAETLISMCADFLMGGLSQDVFASNLTLFAQCLDPKMSRLVEMEAAVAACRDINDSGEMYSHENADGAQALANLFSMLDEEQP